MAGCFILGAASVGLLHREPESIIGILVVLLWFSGLFRPGRTVWQSFLTVGAAVGSVLYAYEAFIADLSTPLVVIGGSILGVLVVTSAAISIRAIVAARRQQESLAPRVRSPLARERTHTSWWVEIVAWIVLVGLPFGAGAWAAEAAFDDQEDAHSVP